MAVAEEFNPKNNNFAEKVKGSDKRPRVHHLEQGTYIEKKVQVTNVKEKTQPQRKKGKKKKNNIATKELYHDIIVLIDQHECISSGELIVLLDSYEYKIKDVLKDMRNRGWIKTSTEINGKMISKNEINRLRWNKRLLIAELENLEL